MAYLGALERVMEAADEVALTARHCVGIVSVQDDVMFELTRALLDAHRLRERLDDSLVGSDHEVDVETMR
jgi:hypothetical protein